jgi:hypothetical protein
MANEAISAAFFHTFILDAFKAYFFWFGASSISVKIMLLTSVAVVHPRLEIRDLLNKTGLKWQRDLFLLALRELMSVPSTEAKSFFQIGGIHGAPFVPYDRVGHTFLTYLQSLSAYIAARRRCKTIYEQTTQLMK